MNRNHGVDKNTHHLNKPDGTYKMQGNHDTFLLGLHIHISSNDIIMTFI